MIPVQTPQTAESGSSGADRLSRVRRARLFGAGAIACVGLGCATLAEAAVLQISVTGIRSDKGLVDLCVFDSDKDFPDCSANRAIVSRRKAAVRGDTQFDVDVAPGLHAVAVLHDENGDGHLNTTFLGIPTEGGGVSNNPPPRMGPPRFSDAAFRLAPGGGRIVVKMVYP